MILGTDGLDVQAIDPSSLRIADVATKSYNLEDLGSPGHPDPSGECAQKDPDGLIDLALTFDTQTVLLAIEDSRQQPVQEGELLVLKVEGMLKEEFGGSRVTAQDTVITVGKKDSD